MVLQTCTTVIARTPAALLSHLGRLPKVYSENPLLFSLSTNIDLSELSTLVSRLTSLSSQTIGCLSAPLEDHRISCSLASFDKRYSVPFRSTIAGRPAPQVGRWHSFRERKQDASVQLELPGRDIDWEEVWGRSVRRGALPPELDTTSPDIINGVIYFSDIASQGFSNALTSLPHATKLGLVASSTPFITGRPVTLFKNDEIYSSGAVGIATKHSSRKPVSHIEFPGLKVITKDLTITRSEGNLITEINGTNPTRLLLSAIQKDTDAGSRSFKEDRFYLGTTWLNQLSKIWGISSGDPTRGTIALESDDAPLTGTHVQLYYHPKRTTSTEVFKYTAPVTGPVLTFISSADHAATVASDSTEGTRVLDDYFLGSSENGMIICRGTEVGWICNGQGMSTSIIWQ